MLKIIFFSPFLKVLWLSFMHIHTYQIFNKRKEIKLFLFFIFLFSHICVEKKVLISLLAWKKVASFLVNVRWFGVVLSNIISSHSVAIECKCKLTKNKCDVYEFQHCHISCNQNMSFPFPLPTPLLRSGFPYLNYFKSFPQSSLSPVSLPPIQTKHLSQINLPKHISESQYFSI